MRGQRLFVRPIERADHDLVASFLRATGACDAVPACGLIGKLLGEIVAVVAIDITHDALRIEEIVVKKELRWKQIGRYMLEELGQMAQKMDRDRLVVDAPPDLREFFRRVGFEEKGGRMVRRLERA